MNGMPPPSVPGPPEGPFEPTVPPAGAPAPPTTPYTGAAGPYGPPPPTGPYGQPQYGPPPYYGPPPKQSKVWLWVILSVVGGILMLGMIVAIAVPVFFSAKSEADLGACKDNLRTIDASIMQYAAAHNGVYPKSIDELVPTYIRVKPKCPTGGEYYISGSSTPSISGSSVPRARCPNGHTY